MTRDVLIEERRGHVALWTLNRPEALNALNAELLRRLAAAAAQAASDRDIRVVVVRGAGERAFCAGADVDELAGLSTAAALAHLSAGQAAFRAVERLGKPVIAAVQVHGRRGRGPSGLPREAHTRLPGELRTRDELTDDHRPHRSR